MSSNQRTLRSILEPENPVESRICSVKRVTPKQVTHAFDPYGGVDATAHDRRFVDVLEEEIQNEEWIAFRVTYRTYLSNVWIQDHYLGGHGSESGQHKCLKLVAAEFLDHCGHQMPRDRNQMYDGSSEYARKWVYSPDSFEVGYSSGIADVACKCDSCNTYVEAGHTTAEKVLNACEPDADTVIVAPYGNKSDLGRRGSEHRLYLFHHGSRF